MTDRSNYPEMSRRSEPQARTARKTRTESKTPADSNADSVEAVETASDSSGGQDARQRICLAAFQLFGTRGYSCTSIQDIADAATVKKSILYYYFASKEDLYQSLLVESATHLRGLLHQGLQAAGLRIGQASKQAIAEAGAEATLAALAETILSLARENRESVRFFLSHIFAVDSDRPPCSAVPVEQVPHTLILAAIESGVSRGELSGDPQLLESLILGGIQVSIIRHLRSPSQQPLAPGYGRLLVRAALEGFRPTVDKSVAQKKSISDGAIRPHKRVSRA